jgi:uncharacterized protein YllA (UPF0747 family)
MQPQLKISYPAAQPYPRECFRRNQRTRKKKNIRGRKASMAANINYMMAMVKEYLSGKIPRYIFELDFQTEILARYKKMVKEHREFAELFYDLLSEDGVDMGDELSDAEFERLIRQQYNEVKSIAEEGFF